MRLRLLIAEADAELVELYRRFLGNCGYTLETARGGVECLAKLREFHPDALLLAWELRWGGADGVLACMREDAGHRCVPVVLTTRDCEPDGEAVCAPPVKYLHRLPFRLSDLHNSLQQVVGYAQVRPAATLRLDPAVPAVSPQLP